MSIPSPRLQRTLVKPATVEGRGYWTGRETRVEFRPASVDSGIVFVRDDLATDSPAADLEARVPAIVSRRQPATRRTVLANAAGAEVAMIEHVMAALAGLGIDNCEVGVTSAEMPACDGSSVAFVDAIDQAGVTEQAAHSRPLVIQRPVRCSNGSAWVEARPPLGDGLSIEYRLDYGAGSSIGRQWLVVELDEPTFRFEVAPARTFLLESEAEAITSQGLGGHVTPQDLLIFRDRPSSPDECEPIDNPLRYTDECVRHKILDVVGDLALAGRPLVGHIVACCSGHRLNGDLVEALLASHPVDLPRRRSA